MHKGPKSLNLSAEVKRLTDAVVTLRRTIHQWPELGFQETRTSAVVANHLRELGVEVHTGIAQTGVLGILRGSGAGWTILLRADMDALPIQEATSLPYASQNDGVMHACGHDGHTGILLGVASLLATQRERFSGTAKFAFQPAEELPPGRAKAMITEAVLENPHVDMVYGLHLWNSSPVGTIGVDTGPIMGSVDRFDAIIEGVGGHGAYPHTSLDPIVISSHIVTALQSIVSREISPSAPLVVTVGRFRAGTAFNVIPSRAEISGTVRTFDACIRQDMPAGLEQIVRGITAAMRAECEFAYDFGYPLTMNDVHKAAFARHVAARIVGEENALAAGTTIGAEDMSYFLQAVPGCYLLLGLGNPDKSFIHSRLSALFDFDEAALPIGVDVLTQLTLAALSEDRVGTG